jgi:hypothetical protein
MIVVVFILLVYYYYLSSFFGIFLSSELLFLFLTVVGVRTMLAAEVLLYEQRIHGSIWVHAERRKIIIIN